MKILIRLPDDFEERLLTFPFLHALHEDFSETIEDRVIPPDLHLMTRKENIECLHLLPFNAFYHELDDEDTKNMFSMHRAAQNAKIVNPELYVCLTSENKDASVGLSLKIKDRLGFGEGKNKWVLNRYTDRVEGMHRCEQYFSLLKYFTNNDYSRFPAVEGRKVEPVIEDWEMLPYKVVDLTLDSEGEIDEKWIEFISFFENKKFIFQCSEMGEDIYNTKIQKFVEKLSPQNIYEVHHYENAIEFAKLVRYADAFVSKAGALSHIASYNGTKTFAIFEEGDPQLTGPLYNLGNTTFLSHSDGTLQTDGKLDFSKLTDRIIDEVS